MRIHTLGTSHGNATISRFNSSTLYETKDGILYLIDAGAPAEALIRRKGFSVMDIRAVFLTHMHDDHVGGLTSLLKQVMKYPEDFRQTMVVHMPMQGAWEALCTWLSAMQLKAEEPYIRNTVVTDGEIYRDDHLIVTAIRTKHFWSDGVAYSFAYMLEFTQENITILHTGDLSGDFTDFPAIASKREFDACVCEATHYSPQSALPTFQQANFRQLIFNHVGDRWHVIWKTKSEFDHGEREMLSYYNTLPYPVSVSHDGDSFLITKK